MQLTAFRIFKYRNIEDSGLVTLADRLTCIVGKNQSGKTNLLSWTLANFRCSGSGDIAANNPQQSWGFEGEPPKAVIKDSGTRYGTS